MCWRFLSSREGEAEAELPEGNMVHIMTVHASKGLEFPIVCLPKLNRSLQVDSGDFRYDDQLRLVAKFKKEKDDNPFSMENVYTPGFNLVKGKSDIAAMEEHKRLFYVAATRARDYLLMTTKGKPKRTSWYSLLLDSITNNPSIAECIIRKEATEVSRQKAWQQKAEEFVAKTDVEKEPIPYTFSVSEIMDFMNDPEMYYERYIYV